jgi:hypothetical protein
VAKPKRFQQRSFDLAREVVIAGIADRAAGKNMLDITKGLWNNMLYTPTFG